MEHTEKTESRRRQTAGQWLIAVLYGLITSSIVLTVMKSAWWLVGTGILVGVRIVIGLHNHRQRQLVRAQAAERVKQATIKLLDRVAAGDEDAMAMMDQPIGAKMGGEQFQYFLWECFADAHGLNELREAAYERHTIALDLKEGRADLKAAFDSLDAAQTPLERIWALRDIWDCWKRVEYDANTDLLTAEFDIDAEEAAERIQDEVNGLVAALDLQALDSYDSFVQLRFLCGLTLRDGLPAAEGLPAVVGDLYALRITLPPMRKYLPAVAQHLEAPSLAEFIGLPPASAIPTVIMAARALEALRCRHRLLAKVVQAYMDARPELRKAVPSGVRIQVHLLATFNITGGLATFSPAFEQLRPSGHAIRVLNTWFPGAVYDPVVEPVTA